MYCNSENARYPNNPATTAEKPKHEAFTPMKGSPRILAVDTTSGNTTNNSSMFTNSILGFVNASNEKTNTSNIRYKIRFDSRWNRSVCRKCDPSMLRTVGASGYSDSDPFRASEYTNTTTRINGRMTK